MRSGPGFNPHRAYVRGPKTTRAKRTNPEAELQVEVKQYLDLCAPADLEWTSSLTGQNLSQQAAELARARGVRRGWPDMQFCINRRMFFIELKAPSTAIRRDPGRYGTLDDPDLTDDQKRVLSHMHPQCWAICRSLEEVAAKLTEWGVKLRAHPFR